MPTAKPAAGTLVNGAYSLAANYGAWLLTGDEDPERDSLNLGSVSAPVVGGVTQGTNPDGGNCRDFNGSTGKLYPIANLVNPAPTVGQEQTIIARIYPRSTSGFRNIYASNSQGFFLDAGVPRLYSQTAATTALTANNWYTVGVTVNTNNSTKYYINGSLDRTIASGTVGFPSGANVGIGGDASGEFFDGLIDYVFLWENFAFGATEHAAIHSDPFAMFASAGILLPNAMLVSP